MGKGLALLNPYKKFICIKIFVNWDKKRLNAEERIDIVILCNAIARERIAIAEYYQIEFATN